jgi:hypothetical protein
MDGGCAVHKVNLHPTIIVSIVFYIYFLSVTIIENAPPNTQECVHLMNNMKQTQCSLQNQSTSASAGVKAFSQQP